MIPQQNDQKRFDECRSSVREQVHAEILLSQSDGKTFRATLSDLSATGFRMSSKRVLDATRPVFIRLPGLPILSAHIRWEGFSDYGCQFNIPLADHVLQHLLMRLKIAG